jgi:hypothetical protein
MNGEKLSPFAKIQTLNVSVAADISNIQQQIQADYEPTACLVILSPNEQLMGVRKKRRKGRYKAWPLSSLEHQIKVSSRLGM